MRRSSDAGANLVEMALILPFLLLLMVGVVDVGRAFYYYISLTNAAREGVRLASQFPFPDTEDLVEELVMQRAMGEPTLGSEVWDDIDVTIQGLGTEEIPAKSGDPITVTVSKPYTVILGDVVRLNGQPVFPPLTIRSYATMIIFGVNDVSGP